MNTLSELAYQQFCEFGTLAAQEAHLNNSLSYMRLTGFTDIDELRLKLRVNLEKQESLHSDFKRTLKSLANDNQ